MSERPEPLVAPSAVTWSTVGDVGSALVDFTQALLPEPEPGEAVSPSPVVAFVEPEMTVAQLVSMITSLQGPRHRRLWLVVPDASLLDVVAGALPDVPDAMIDAIVILSDEPTRLAAVALAAWIVLRHDAPSAALGDLHDVNGDNCNVAVISGAIPTSPPVTSPRTPRVPAHLTIDEFLPELDHKAEVFVDEVARQDDIRPTEVLTDISGHAQDVAESMSQHVIQQWASADASTLREAVEQLPLNADESLTPVLTDDTLRVTELTAALARENAGFGSWWGRRKRVAMLASELDQARTDWLDQLRRSSVTLTRARFIDVMRDKLATRADLLQADEAQRTVQSKDQAQRRWLAGARATAAGLPNIAVGQVQHSWGSAAPHTRRHLFIPVMDAIEIDSDAEISIHEVYHLHTPLALAVVLGLPMSAVRGNLVDE
jgi:hypothetical protein